MREEEGDRGQKSEVGWKNEIMQINSAKDLDVYKKAYELAMTIFRLEQDIPR